MVPARVRWLFDSVLLMGIALVVVVPIWGWQRLDEPPGLGSYLVAAWAVMVLALASLYLLPVMARINATLVLAAGALSLWGASALLYERAPLEDLQQQRLEAARAAGVDFDGRTRAEMLADLRAAGIDAHPPLGPERLLFAARDDGAANGSGTTEDLPVLPLAGMSNAVTMLCNESGEFLILETDRFGFNNPDHAYDAPSPVLLVGDSYTFGYCVSPGDDLAGQLRAEGIDVLNLGYPGTGPLAQLATLREYGPLAQPSLILWIYYEGNDIRELREEYGMPAFRRYLDPAHRQDLPTRQEEVDAFWAEEHTLAVPRGVGRPSEPLTEILLLRPLRRRLGIAVGRASGRDPLPEAFDTVAGLMVAEAERLGAPLHFVYLPTYGQFVEGRHSEPYRAEVMAAVSRWDIPIVDFETRMRETGDPLQFYPFRLHSHFNEEGYALLAEQILEEVPALRSDLPAIGTSSATESRDNRH